MRTTIPTLVLLSLALLPTPATAAVRVERPFVLLAERGDATTWTLHPAAPGAITAEATWGGGERLTLALEGPDKSGHLARQSGTSPLVLRFPLSAEQLRLDGEWRLTLFNFSGRALRGKVEVTWPGTASPLVLEQETIPKKQAVAAAVAARAAARPDRISQAEIARPPKVEPLPQPESAGEVRRTVLPDGRVRIDHPDGWATIYGPGMTITRVAPDGTETPFMFKSQVQEATLPPPPGDPAFQSFLGDHEEQLLRQIRFLVHEEDQAVANYLAHEADQTASVVERIDLRRHYVDVLLGLGP